MIDQEIIKLASNTSNYGLKNKYSHKVTLKNNICGDKITLELMSNGKKIIQCSTKLFLVYIARLQLVFYLKKLRIWI